MENKHEHNRFHALRNSTNHSKSYKCSTPPSSFSQMQWRDFKEKGSCTWATMAVANFLDTFQHVFLYICLSKLKGVFCLSSQFWNEITIPVRFETWALKNRVQLPNPFRVARNSPVSGRKCPFEMVRQKRSHETSTWRFATTSKVWFFALSHTFCTLVQAKIEYFTNIVAILSSCNPN